MPLIIPLFLIPLSHVGQLIFGLTCVVCHDARQFPGVIKDLPALQTIACYSVDWDHRDRICIVCFRTSTGDMAYKTESLRLIYDTI